LCTAAKRFAACCFLGRFLPKLGDTSRCRLFFRRRCQGCGIGDAASGRPRLSARDDRMWFPGNRVLTLGRTGVISRPPQTGGPASPGQPETPTASTARPEDKGPSLQRFLSYCPRADVLSSCRNAGASCFGRMRQLYDAQPVQTALIFENRIGLLEASTLAGVLPGGPMAGIRWWCRRLKACFLTSRVVSGA
jgi:hypothetical protein